MPSSDPLYIDAGSLRHSIQIQAPTATRDAVGQPSSTWATVLTTRARIENTNSRTFKESFSNNALASQSTDVITIRYPGASVVLKPGMHVLFEDNIYLIQGVDNVLRRNRKVVLACMVVDGDSN